MLIRTMTAEDIPAVCEIEKKSICPPWSYQAFWDALHQDTLMMIAQDQDSSGILGYIVMYISFEEGEITNVAVDPEKRKGGIGSGLMKEFLLHAREKGVERIVLEVRKSNVPAIGLYRKTGFEELGIRRNFYEQPKEDALIMELKLC